MKSIAAKGSWRIGLFFAVERLIKRKSTVGAHRFFDPALFPWIPAVEEACGDIRAELEDVLRAREAMPNFQDISADQAALTRDNKWKTFFFLAYGRSFEQNQKLCPRTTAALSRIPGVVTAFFSILMPQKRIPPHRGPYAGVLRYHLGLKVPARETQCGITVGGETSHWTEGKSMVFDDTYIHHAWNMSDDVRVILFVDVLRPLPFPFSLLNRMVMKLVALAPWVRKSANRRQGWDKTFMDAYQKANQ